MFGKFLKMNKIEFTVNGKPPKKTKPSLWSKNSNQTQQVIKLRQEAYNSTKKLKDEYLHDAVKLSLVVYDPNPTERKDRSDYLGDLDALVGGVFEALQASPPENNNLEIHPLLKEAGEIRHNIPIIVADDAQITTIAAEKRTSKEQYYKVVIQRDDDFT